MSGERIERTCDCCAEWKPAVVYEDGTYLCDDCIAALPVVVPPGSVVLTPEQVAQVREALVEGMRSASQLHDFDPSIFKPSDEVIRAPFMSALSLLEPKP